MTEQTSSIATVPRCVPGWTSRSVNSSPFVLGIVPGEGIGPEVVGAALSVLDVVADVYGLTFDLRTCPDLGPKGPYGHEFREGSAEFYAATFADGGAVFCGAVGGRYVYQQRAAFSLYCKLVPVRPSWALRDASIVRPERLDGVDILIIRENVAGLYLGDFGRRDRGNAAFQHATYTADEVDRILLVAARAALARDGRFTYVTKRGGIPEVSALWAERAKRIAHDLGAPADELEIDNACFQLVADPRRFDVLVAPNMLGDVLTDVAALVLGSRGMSLSANFGDDGTAVYQTAHGAAHDLAGTDRANPVAQILSLAMMLRESYGLVSAAQSVEVAIEHVLGTGMRTADVAGPGSTVVGTRALADLIAEAVTRAPVPAGE